jgi:hypothetical protein
VAQLDSLKPEAGGEGTARTWVNVRAANNRGSEIVGVITPDTRVRFGERRAGWIQVTSARILGWADPRLFVVVR